MKNSGDQKKTGGRKSAVASSQDGRRVERVQKEVTQIVSRFLMGTFKGDLPGIVTVTNVMMPPDLRSARVQVSVLGGTAEQNLEAAEVLQERAREMQRFLASELPMRFTPKLQFYPDKTLDKVLKIDKILHEIKKENRPSSDRPLSESEDEE
ncbi:MAG: 30S ribosome-binding factor RbfA [Bdellovibrio sp.]|jgi:ribosome-binding factor A